MESQDIDIALDTMKGNDFCKLLQESYSKHSKKVSGIGVIKANSEKSKHLETAVIHIEKYTEVTSAGGWIS